MKFVIALINKIKVLICFIFISSFFYPNIANSKNNCNKIQFNTNFNEITFIDIRFDNHKKWTKNGLKILKSKQNSKFIPDKYKKRFKASLVLNYKDNRKCFFEAQIRQNGDYYDHIVFKNGNILQSLDVHLKNDNIFGATKFKLFIPITRRGENEIIISSLLTQLGFIAPKTSFIKVNLNGKKESFIFQEKSSKELIERSLLKDAPIYEANENLVIGTSKNKETVFNKQLTFIRQINTKWIKSQISKDISKEGLTRLNSIYFTNISKMADNKKKYNQLTLDNKMLANRDHEHLMKLNVYDAIINATDSGHALIPHNRKFYYDPYKKQFHPIFYDGSGGTFRRYLFQGWKSKIIKIDAKQIRAKWGISNNAIAGANTAIKQIDKINTYKFSKDLNLKGLKYDENQVKKLFKTINYNLSMISKIENEDNSNFSISLNNYFNQVSKLSKKFAIMYSIENNQYLCENSIKNCNLYKLDEKKFRRLIKGELTKQNKKILYLGVLKKNQSNDFEFNFNAKKPIFFKKNYKIGQSDIKMIISKNINFNLDKSKKILTINLQNKDWIVLYDSIIDDLKIVVNYKNQELYKDNNKKDRFNEYFLTGCLNIFNSNFNKSKLEINNSKCEDAINIVKSKGALSEVKIYNSLYDGLDIDFSKIDINNLNISSSGNDCIDLSNGKYYINFAELKICGDKGISIGEKSKVKINNIEVLNSNIGIAVKDSSEAMIKNSKIMKSKSCISAYKKKDEFDGGKVDILNLECLESNKKTNKDEYSLIKIEKSI